MLIVNHDETDYKITFKHDKPVTKDGQIEEAKQALDEGEIAKAVRLLKLQNRRTTMCKITSVPVGKKFKDEATDVSVGYAICSENDNFTREKGRITALNRATSQLVDSELKKKLFETYLSRKG